MEIDEGYYCQNCEYIISKQKHQIDKEIHRQDNYFSTRLPYPNKKIGKKRMNMVNNNYNRTEHMINELQSLKGETKLRFFKNKSIFYADMNIRKNEDLFAKIAQGVSKIDHEVLSLMIFLQTKPEVKSMTIKYYDLYYTVIKNTDDKEIVNNKYEYDYISLNDVIIPNHYVEIKCREK